DEGSLLMKDGLYEKILDNISKRELENKSYKKIRNVDESELSRVISTAYQKIIREALSQITDESEKLEFIQKLNNTIGIEDFEYKDKGFKELLAVHNDENCYNILNKYRPRTSISTSTLFTGNSGPT